MEATETIHQGTCHLETCHQETCLQVMASETICHPDASTEAHQEEADSSPAVASVIVEVTSEEEAVTAMKRNKEY
jgi:hypothetical protein